MRKFLMIIFLVSNTGLALASWDGPTKKSETDLKYFLHSGFTFEAVLKTAIFSFNTITPVVAEVEFDIKFNEKVMLPKGTKLIGACQVEKSVDRVNVVFKKIIFPNGQEIAANAIALTIDGSGGVTGKIKNKDKKGVLPAKVMLTSAGIAAGTVTQDVFATQMIQELSQDVSQQIQEKVTYSISVPKDKEILVFVVDRVEY